MSTQTLSVATTITTPLLAAKEEIVRRTAEYHPSIWGDFFISYDSEFDDGTIQAWGEEAEVLKEKVRGMLTVNFAQKLLGEKLKLIDAIQRLGISYHFEGELKEALQQIRNDYEHYPYDVEDNLHITSLQFRLLREYGYNNVSCDIFNKLKDRDGGFEDSLAKMDLEAMLSLYEATHLRVHGETILDEILTFVRTQLQSMVNDLNPFEAKQVLHALSRPIRKGLTRLEAREYISFYQEDQSHNEILLRFGKLDFNLLQKQHQKELSIVTKWWEDLEVDKNLPFARNRLVECYFWIVGVYYEPQYVIARKFLTKVISMTSIIDDIYDNYGINSELQMFTNAVDRWEKSAMDELPDYMKITYQALLDVYDEMEVEMRKEGRAYAVSSAREAMKRLVKAYYEESKWLNKEDMPTMEEYMNVALVTSGYPMLATAALVGMGEIATKEAFEWLLSDEQPPIIKASSIICRIMDDMVPYKFEQERGHTPSAVQCYMNKYQVSELQTYIDFNKKVEDAWKDINQALLEDHQAISKKFLMRILNFARVIDLLYTGNDNYANSTTIFKKSIAVLFVDPVDI